MAVITWTVKAEIANGPSFSKSTNMTVEAYEKIDVVIPAGGQDVEVTVDGGGLQFLAIRVDTPSPLPAPSQLKYAVNDAAADPVALDQAVQLMVGEGLIGLLGANPLESLFFSNDAAGDATISILVGRDATP